MSIGKLRYDVYVKKHEEISKYEQANYESYERTILTLSAAFLAFSVSFLGLLRKAESGTKALEFSSQHILIWSWICFATSIFFMLICFPVGALAHRKEIIKLEKALDDASSLDEANKWSFITYCLYILSGAAFILGLILLLLFCSRNIYAF